MATSGSPTSSARLYAFLLKLRPLQQGTLMPFSGELVHGAFLKWLASAAPNVANWLHEGQKRRLFTCSGLHFSQPMQPHLKAERQNIHLPLDPQKTYTVRLTLLLGELFPLFHQALMQFNASDRGASAPPFMQLGKQLFLLEEVVLGDDSTGWTGFTSLETLVEETRQMPFSASLVLEFASLCTFNRGSAKLGYGTYHTLFPQPLFVFQSLLRRWEDIASPELASLIQRERLEQYLQADGIIVVDYDLTVHHVHFTTHRQRGFLGTCAYQLRGPNERSDAQTSLTLRQQVHLLARLAFYSGIGYKTAMGMGQTRVIAKGRD